MEVKLGSESILYGALKRFWSLGTRSSWRQSSFPNAQKRTHGRCWRRGRKRGFVNGSLTRPRYTINACRVCQNLLSTQHKLRHELICRGNNECQYCHRVFNKFWLKNNERACKATTGCEWKSFTRTIDAEQLLATILRVKAKNRWSLKMHF